MKNQELFFAAQHIRQYVIYDICNDTITNGLAKTFANYTIQKTNLPAVDHYLTWLEKEIDDKTAMKYIQKPSPELPDDTVIAVFYTNVWNKLIRSQAMGRKS